MKTVYLDCASGISGDMTIAAFLDAQLITPKSLLNELRKLRLPATYSLKKVRKNGFQATQFQVKENKGKRIPATYRDIKQLLARSHLEKATKRNADAILLALGKAEATAHGISIESVHFHEVGAVDSIADIVGAAHCFASAKATIYCSRVNVGGGMTRIQHGSMNVPAPATAELLKSFECYSHGNHELTTPTGAAILHALTQQAVMPPMKLLKTGKGAGTLTWEEPNLLRVYYGEVRNQWLEDSVLVIEASVDDMNPEYLPLSMEKLMKAGALDAFVQPIGMKKGRMGIKLTALCALESREKVMEAFFRNTTTIGLRYYVAQRGKLYRRKEDIGIGGGKLKGKRSWMFGEEGNVKPEYNEVKKQLNKKRPDVRK
ncbi:nickel pincer cofactor biosynthesis protein LarC [Candidatus Micrarchaeota archaeon]|nr:nickel pincer cofactor biosynthesis protein LarC [Candidatus Micrarchaeota archaeon]